MSSGFEPLPLPLPAAPLPLPLPGDSLPLPAGRPERVDPARGSRASVAANAERGRWLSAVREGDRTLADFLAAAATTPALRKVRVTRLLAAHFGTEPATQLNRTVRLMRLAGAKTDRRLAGRVDVAWLIDRRTDGTRLWALSDTITDHRVKPWPGFPYAPRKAA